MSEHILANIDLQGNTPVTKLPDKKSLQLSFLSFSLGMPDDVAILFCKPTDCYLNRIEKLDLPVKKYITLPVVPKNIKLNPWKINQDLHVYAQSENASLKYPYHFLHDDLDSKAKSFEFHKPHFDSYLISSKSQLLDFLKEKSGLFVLKTDLDQSGKGHFFIDLDQPCDFQIPQSIKIENCRLERWVERIVDFSSQWLLDDDVYCLGMCEILNNSKGAYQGSVYPFSKHEYDDFIIEHIDYVKPLLKEFLKNGFRGHLGIDAFVYKENKQIKLCPLIEINPRKTMGYVALSLSQHYKKPVKLVIDDYDQNSSLLPNIIHAGGFTYNYRKNLNFQLL